MNLDSASHAGTWVLSPSTRGTHLQHFLHAVLTQGCQAESLWRVTREIREMAHNTLVRKLREGVWQGCCLCTSKSTLLGTPRMKGTREKTLWGDMTQRETRQDTPFARHHLFAVFAPFPQFQKRDPQREAHERGRKGPTTLHWQPQAVHESFLELAAATESYMVAAGFGC